MKEYDNSLTKQMFIECADVELNFSSKATSDKMLLYKN